MNKRVVVAMSGGVDSSVAAALLVRDGYEVVGVTLQLRDCQGATRSRSCCGVDSVVRARAVCANLGVAHYVLDWAEVFERQVLEPAWASYDRARTPSPCLLCNEHIKFGRLLGWAHQLGRAKFATGHYARIGHDDLGLPCVLRGKDSEKDQSYFLAGIPEAHLRSVMFPLGMLTKGEVRDLARSMRLPVADQPESQDACMLSPGETFAESLRRRFGATPRTGPILDSSGNRLGWHPGIHRFTVGQRRGLRLTAGRRFWVRSICAESAEVIVSSDPGELMSTRVIASGLSPIARRRLEKPRRCQVQVRHRGTIRDAQVTNPSGDLVEIALDRPVWAVAPGQAAVLYDGERVMGRGWIA